MVCSHPAQTILTPGSKEKPESRRYWVGAAGGALGKNKSGDPGRRNKVGEVAGLWAAEKTPPHRSRRSALPRRAEQTWAGDLGRLGLRSPRGGKRGPAARSSGGTSHDSSGPPARSSPVLPCPVPVLSGEAATPVFLNPFASPGTPERKTAHLLGSPRLRLI